jgi:hypothetical protein
VGDPSMTTLSRLTVDRCDASKPARVTC